MNAGNILKPALSRGEIQVIGATTFNEYRKYIEKDQALERRFQPVRVEEPSVADTLAVMNGIKHYYEEHHHVQVPADVLSATVTLSERYITDRYLPDKAIDLLDEACACCNLAHPVISEYLDAAEGAGRPASRKKPRWTTPMSTSPSTMSRWPSARPALPSWKASCPPSRPLPVRSG